MDKWNAKQGRGKEKRKIRREKIRREKIREEKESEERKYRCVKKRKNTHFLYFSNDIWLWRVEKSAR